MRLYLSINALYGIKYSKGIRPKKGHNMAIAEWPTKPVTSQNKRNCYADYALFIGEKLYAFIEAKACYKDIAAVIDNQCKDYSSNVRDEDSEYIISTYGKYQVPFTFATNGRPYLEEYKQKSGIWFLDFRAVNNAPQALKGWMSPNGLEELLNIKPDPNFQRLQQEPYDVLINPRGLNLRYYQVEAIKAVEECIKQGQDKILLAMATGTGKTRTILGLIYRMLKTNTFKRILYLVDRNSLGKQTLDVFNEVELESFLPLGKIYNINKLTDLKIEKSTKVQIATVQSMVKRILYTSASDYDKQDNNTFIPGVNDFDLIIIDEAHRGYILDKEMTEDEAMYSNQLDYQSKYRQVIDYFKATKVALTATPALQTVKIFGNPVYNYSYRKAVLDGNLVDFDAPHIIKTKFNTLGITYDKGDEIKYLDKETSEIKTFTLDDEINFDAESLNRDVITSSFNRTVLEEIAKDIDPSTPDISGKTLIYAVNDTHADLIVSILKDIYTQQGIDNDAIMKITGASEDGNRDKIQECINKFKNERYPSIVVTVDLLTTGIDIPSITKLVFLRCVKSRILYEQMLGRATRLCPDLNKDHFEIYDTVGITDKLADFTTMKPVVALPKEKFSNLFSEIKTCSDDKKLKFFVEKIVGKLQRKIKSMDDHAKENFKTLSNGLSPQQFIDKIKGQKDLKDTQNVIVENEELFNKIDSLKNKSENIVIISNKNDSLQEHIRAYGEQNKTAEDYLEEFNLYIKENKDKIDLLNLVCTRPSNLTRKTLRDLISKIEIDGFTKQQLVSAVKTVSKSNADLSLDLTTIIRNIALDEPLEDHKEKIERAFKKLIQSHSFSNIELNWLKKFKEYLKNDEETVLTLTVLDEDSRFKKSGGSKRIDNYFNNKLDAYIKELNDYIYNLNGISI